MAHTMVRDDALPVAAQSGLRAGVPPMAGTSTLRARDGRADGEHRTVVLSSDCVRIDRRLAGIHMRVAVPVRAYKGVALSLSPGADDGLHYQLHLLHRDADLSVAIACAGDDADIIADWRSWSRFFSLPALVERRPGLIEEADVTLGGLPVGDAGADRRPGRARARRRPQFLARRKPGDARVADVVHAGEREIIART